MWLGPGNLFLWRAYTENGGEKGKRERWVTTKKILHPPAPLSSLSPPGHTPACGFLWCAPKTYFRFCMNLSQGPNSCFTTIGPLNPFKDLPRSQPSRWLKQHTAETVWLCLLVLLTIHHPFASFVKTIPHLIFETGSCCIGQASPKLSIFLSSFFISSYGCIVCPPHHAVLCRSEMGTGPSGIRQTILRHHLGAENQTGSSVRATSAL